MCIRLEAFEHEIWELTNFAFLKREKVMNLSAKLLLLVCTK